MKTPPSNKSLHIRRRSWRFYRNWLLYMLMWAFLLSIALSALRDPLPIYYYLLGAYPVYCVGASIFYAYRFTHPGGRFVMSRVTPANAGLEYETVEFASRDGLILFGWYLPGKNRAATILVHGHGSKGIVMIYHASALVAKGYAVLIFDLRAHGSSDGEVCTNGWMESNDLLGAVDYLRSRDDVDADKIGVLGLSLGGQVALRAAAQDETLRAVVAEDPNPAILQDHGDRPASLLDWVRYPRNWLFYRLLTFMNGAQPPSSLRQVVAQIAPKPLLLIATGKGNDLRFTQRLYDCALKPKELWRVPQAKHAGGYFHDPEEYQKHVVSFFDQALFGRL
jgi:dipeptidyl aminopeptidase/acylaminoacyl peptidase